MISVRVKTFLVNEHQYTGLNITNSALSSLESQEHHKRITELISLLPKFTFIDNNAVGNYIISIKNAIEVANIIYIMQFL